MKKRLLTVLAVAFVYGTTFAQKSFSLNEAIAYALNNNVQVKKAKIDRTIADQKVKETIGIGLPQINGQARYVNNIEIPVSLIDASRLDFSGQTPPGTIVGFPMGLAHNANVGITVSQLLFNGSYIVGLESSKTYKETAALIDEKTEISIKEAVMMTYAGILATDENIKTLDVNKKILEKNLNDTRIVYKTGLTELQNVEQLEYSYKNLSTVVENLKRTRAKLTAGLKYLIGMPADEDLVLTSTFSDVLNKNKESLSIANQISENHIDLRLKQNQIRINELLLKLEKSKALPTLAAVFFSGYNTGSNTFNLFNSDKKWFNSTYFALQLDIPIFSGLQRHWKTQQAKLNLSKSQLDKEDTMNQLKNELFQKNKELENAMASYQTAEELIKLSQEIYRKQQIKFKEGLGTSFELSQAESQLYEAQTKYYQSAIELIQAKVRLDKAVGIL